MQTVTDNFKNSVIRKTPTYTKVVELCRRYWNGSAYIQDTVIDITNEVIEVERIIWKLDSEGYAVWNASNTTLTIRNDRNQWLQNNAKGHFPTNYIINKSQIKIKLGTLLADGTFETIYVFSGQINDDPVYSPDNKTIDVTITSILLDLENFNAEDIATQVASELLGSNSGTEFTTSHNGVGLIKEIRKGTTAGGWAGASILTPVTDYSIDDLNLLSTPAKITLVVGLTAGNSVWAKYSYWYQNKTLDWIVEQIMILCGIANYNIDPIVFSNSIENTHTWDIKADWDLGTFSDTASDVHDGDVVLDLPYLYDDFEDGIYTDKWTKVGTGILMEASGYLSMNPSNYYFLGVKKAINQNFLNEVNSEWSLKILINSASTEVAQFNFFGTSNSSQLMGYYLQIFGDGIQLMKGIGGTVTTLLTIAYPQNHNWHTYKIIRNPAGLFSVYVDDVFKGSVTDTSITSASYIHIMSGSAGLAGVSTNYVDDCYINLFYSTGNYISDVLDGGASLTAWGTLESNTDIPANTNIIIYTRSSADNIDWTEAWQTLEVSGQIKSLQRYLQYKAEFTTLDLRYTAYLQQVIIKYYTTTTTIPLVNLTGMTAKQTLEEIVNMFSGEMGFNANDYFFIRPRNSALPSVIDFHSDTNIIELSNASDGIDRVYNYITATFGIYTKVYNSTDKAEASPTSIKKYGTRQYNISSSNLLPADSVNLAFAIAPTVFDYTYLPRKRCQIKTMLIPQLELGDKVKLYYKEPVAFRLWKWGDGDIVFGQSDLEYYSEATLSTRYKFWGNEMRIEGIEIDSENWQMVFDLTEIL